MTVIENNYCVDGFEMINKDLSYGNHRFDSSSRTVKSSPYNNFAYLGGQAIEIHMTIKSIGITLVQTVT